MPIYASGGSGTVLNAQGVFTPTEINNCMDSPVVLVPAIPGKVLIPVAFTLFCKKITIPYADISGLFPNYWGVWNIPLANWIPFDTNTFEFLGDVNGQPLESLIPVRAFINDSISVNKQMYENAPIFFSWRWDGSAGGGLAGDGPVPWFLTYAMFDGSVLI